MTIPNSSQKQIYIVISQTGTILSRLLKIITGAKYNHVSLSFENNLETMYSFGRLQAYNPFWAGFVLESPHHGTFKRFVKTDVIILSLPVKEELYSEMKRFLEKMYHEKQNYQYNYLGLILAAFRINYKPARHYYCSEFVRYILVHFGLMQFEQVDPIVQPIHFLEVFQNQVVYRGKLHEYSIDSI